MTETSNEQKLKRNLRSQYYSSRASSTLRARILHQIEQNRRGADIGKGWGWSLNGAIALLIIALTVIILNPETEQTITEPGIAMKADIPSLSHLPKPAVHITVPGIASLTTMPSLPSVPTIPRKNFSPG